MSGPESDTKPEQANDFDLAGEYNGRVALCTELWTLWQTHVRDAGQKFEKGYDRSFHEAPEYGRVLMERIATWHLCRMAAAKEDYAKIAGLRLEQIVNELLKEAAIRVVKQDMPDKDPEDQPEMPRVWTTKTSLEHILKDIQSAVAETGATFTLTIQGQ